MAVSRTVFGSNNAHWFPATGVQILPNLIAHAKKIITWFRSPTHVSSPSAFQVRDASSKYDVDPTLSWQMLTSTR